MEKQQKRLYVRKRDGKTIVSFDPSKIAIAIRKAMEKVGDVNLYAARKIANLIYNEYYDILQHSESSSLTIDVETIQDAVEYYLSLFCSIDVLREYTTYRYRRNQTRDVGKELVNIANDILYKNDRNILHENANLNGDSFSGKMSKFGSEFSKWFSLNEMIKPHIAAAHKEGIIHIHDLDNYPIGNHNCIFIDMGRLLKDGFSTGNGSIRECNSLDTAFALIPIIFQSQQNTEFGGMADPHIDYSLAPYVKKSFLKHFKKAMKYFNNDKDLEDLVERSPELICIDNPDLKVSKYKKIYNYAYNETIAEAKQGAQAFIHNLNTMSSRAGGQIPFTSINYGTDISTEGRIVVKAILEATMDGLGQHETPIFPIQVFKAKKGVNLDPGDPNYDLFQLAIKCFSKRMYPNIVNVDATFNKQYYVEGNPDTEVATMGCIDGRSKIKYINSLHKSEKELISIAEFYENMKNDPNSSPEVTCNDGSKYIGLDGIYIKDGLDSYTRCLKVIKRPDRGDWYKVCLDSNSYQAIYLTEDHPLPIFGKGRVMCKDIVPGDPLTLVYNNECIINVPVKSVEFIGNRDEYSYDVETMSDYFIVDNILSHNCRTRVMSDRHGWIGVSGKGNISPCTINLVRCGIENGLLYTGCINVKGFYEQLKSYLDLAMEELLDRYEYQASQLAKMSDFMMREGIWRHGETLNENESVRELLKHGTLSIGFIGLAECMKAMFGKHHAEDSNIYKFAYDVIKYIRNYCDEASEKYDMNVTCYATPAEGLSGRYTKMDRERFGVISGVTDREYYTNSFHVPVYYHTTIENKIDLEAPFHELCNAGHITYIELTSPVANNLEAVESIVKYALSKNIGYFAMNIPIDRCEHCGYEGEIPEDDCPLCHSSEIARLRRVTGYLTGNYKKRFNQYKQAEVRDRVKHDLRE